MKAILIAAALCAAIAVPAAAEHGGKGKHKGHRPDVIQLPKDFSPEGIATANRHTFFVGSRDTGAIYRGSLRTGEGSILVEGGPAGLPVPDDRGATGLKVDRRGRLFASGADSKHIRVYDARTGDQIRDYLVPEAGFINDVIVTRRGAYFTDSNVRQLYFIPFGDHGALGELERIPITGDFTYTAGAFNANGIEAARGGKTLISVKSVSGELFAIDAASGASKQIALDKPVTNGDGLLRRGRNLFVVRNQDNLVAVVKLRRNLSAGHYKREIKSDEFKVPTTIARSGGRKYVVNAKFGLPNPDGSFEVVKVPRR